VAHGLGMMCRVMTDSFTKRILQINNITVKIEIAGTLN